MLHSGRFTVILDANVIYPAPLRDLLLSLAEEGLYTAKWTSQIQEEWIRNLLKNRNDLKEEQLKYTAEVMNIAFPDANVSGYESLFKGLDLPDEKDKHILAAAIRCKANVIVTNNIKDFPKVNLSKFDIEAQTPDEFIVNIIDLDSEGAINALKKQVSRLKNPPQTLNQVIKTLDKNGLHKSVKQLRKIIEQKEQ